ncbi:FtsK/SpoIIIE domain-containing protein [Varibaculum vaginae]|uniref:FtsK/SpoIIIE domain-containing protein n=1 Tax=Varibaculum vaginae TaxID=2364797 RepID=UPI001F35ECEF|nr:FHA domain-containing protein [Varibaculum vaginae]
MSLESVRQALAAPCHLQVERGPAAGLVLPLQGNYCRIGRHELGDLQVSRDHLLFMSKNGKLRVRDLDSRNGSFRGKNATVFSRLRFEQEIGTSSRIRAGNTVLKVSPRPHRLTVPPPRPRSGVSSWRQWLFLPMLILLPISVTSPLHIPRIWGLILIAVLAAGAMSIWLYRRPRPVTPAQLLMVASQPKRSAASLAAIEPVSREVAAWISPHKVVRARPGDKICFTGTYARERALWWAAQLAWQESTCYRLELQLHLSDFATDSDHLVDVSDTINNQSLSVDAFDLGNPHDDTPGNTQTPPRVILISPLGKLRASEKDICITWAKNPGTAAVWANRIVRVPDHRRATVQADLPSLIWCRLFADTCIPMREAKIDAEVTFEQLWSEVFDASNPPLKIATNWKHSLSLRAPVARDAQGTSFLDLVKDGPHALLAGTTGAGKSAALTTWLLSMALSHPPSKLQYVLVDYKGGDAFGKLKALPHVLGILTDLEPALTRRAILSLKAEIKYREQHKYLSHPRIVVVVDEFRVLATDHPDLLDSLIRLATLGRSLGIHLVLATQRPAGIVDGQIKSNMALRICLRVLETADSCDVIGDSRCAQLPATPGRAWIKSATDARGKLVQFAWIPQARQAEQLSKWCRAAWKPPYLPHLPWAPPLPNRIGLSQLPSKKGTVVLGLGDYPHRQKTAPLLLPLPFSLHLVGSAGSGRTSLALMLAIQLANMGREVHIICHSARQFFGSSFNPQHEKNWPGTIATTPQVSLELLKRASTGQLAGTLIIDDCEDVLDALERTYGPLSGSDLLAGICRQSEALGFSLLLVSSPSGASSRLFQGLKTQILGKIRDDLQAAQAGFNPQISEMVSEPGVFIFSPSQVATPFRAAEAPASLPARFLNPPRLRLRALPTRFLGPLPTTNNPKPRIFARGLSQPMELEDCDLQRDWLIIGESGSGKSNAAQILSAFMPEHTVLEELNNHDCRLSKTDMDAGHSFGLPQADLAGTSTTRKINTGKTPVIATVSPQVLQAAFSGSLAELRQRAILLILGNAAQCRPFLKGIDYQALPDQVGQLPGRGILVKEGKGLAIQMAIFSKLS